MAPSTTYNSVTSNKTTDYTATTSTYTISGTVTATGSGLENVLINSLPGNPFTDANGNYTATVDYGWSGTVTPTLTGYTFTPPSTTYNNVVSNQTANYTTAQIPNITVTSPNGGENWDVDSSVDITWAGNAGGSVNIRLSRDNGVTWETLFANTSNDGSEPRR